VTDNWEVLKDLLKVKNKRGDSVQYAVTENEDGTTVNVNDRKLAGTQRIGVRETVLKYRRRN